MPGSTSRMKPKIEGGARRVLGDEGAEGLDHPQAKVVAKRHLSARDGVEARGELIEKSKIPISEVDPLRDT